ncbi:MAG: glycosyltransferase [Chloroflexi bacterium]|jgi:glycosyltransferase involved in cell wall biosynthesis|nr:glycosyltransferase [Chloroflexota bacterium]
MADCWAEGWTVHQLTVGMVRGDAISDAALLLRDWLREAGARSEIYAEQISAELAGEVRPYHELTVDPGRRERVIFHFSIGSPISAFARQLPAPLVMVYHNITPPELFFGALPHAAAATAAGRWELGSFANVGLALGDSEWNRRELEAAGYPETGVLPLAVDPRRFSLAPDPAVLAEYGDGRTNLLTVSKIAPHKRQEDVIKAFAYYKRLDPTARLLVVGGVLAPRYQRWLEQLVSHLRLRDVVFTDRVSDAALRAYYQVATVYLSMSEHEGFGVPLIEALASGVPVIAYAAAAVPETLGPAGILVHEKCYPVIAELIARVVHDHAFRAQLIATGRERVQAFAPERVRAVFRAHLEPRLVA